MTTLHCPTCDTQVQYNVAQSGPHKKATCVSCGSYIKFLPKSHETTEETKAPTLSRQQQHFLDEALAGKNIFLTGKAGTGKSFIVKHAIDVLRKTKKVVAIAPTGVAANNINGQTIHSMFSLNPYGITNFESCNFLKNHKRDLFKNIDVIFIDEVSMLRPDILDGMQWTLRKNGLPGLETKQIIFIGDMKQLPPILSDNDRSVLYQDYDGDTFNYAKIYRKLAPVTVELDEVLRQTDEEFIEHLNIIRDGKKSEYFRQFVNSTPKGIILAPHNATVQEYNAAGLNAQQGELFTFVAEIDGTLKPEDFNLEKEIKVKNGCKIMYLVNSKDNPLRNGTLGIFVSVNGCHYIKVDGVEYALAPVMQSKKEYVYDKEEDKLILRDLGSITQYPFKLAYALSIHKSQGLTFDEVTIDLRKPCFVKEQMYVAISRVRGPQGLRIIVN